MRDIVISIRNNFVAEAVIRGLSESGEFQPYKLLFSRENEVVSECGVMQPDLLLCEVSTGKRTNLKTRLAETRAVRQSAPQCKIVYLCDEHSSPEIAKQVMQAKKDGLIDGFFYSSVGSRYLVAALIAI